jgi:ATP-dependent Clp protease ATP-binding subunit ClpA
MSECVERHAVARLIGAPPGYRRLPAGRPAGRRDPPAPYSALLLEEIENAHPDIFNIRLQVMDHATLTDHNGRKADLRPVVLIMASNAGSRDATISAPRASR